MYIPAGLFVTASISGPGIERKPRSPQLRERSCSESPVPPLWICQHDTGEAAGPQKRLLEQQGIPEQIAARYR